MTLIDTFRYTLNEPIRAHLAIYPLGMHLRGKTILNRFLTRSGHFVTSRREPLRAIRECYTVAIFARVLKSKLSDTSSLDYPPLRYVPMQNICTIILHSAFCILHSRVSVLPLPHLLDL